MKIGFIGVGHMGKHMAANLIRAGHELRICDARPDARDEPVLAGARWVGTPAQACQGADLAITSLPGPDQVTEVVLSEHGVLAGLPEHSFYIDMSTSTPENIRGIAEAAAAKDIGVLDAPVAGGMRGARKATLTIMVGGDDRSFAACLPVLGDMGSNVIHVGPCGAGHVAKLVNNMMTIVNGLTAMEAMVVGVKAGVDPAKLIEVAQAGTGGSFSLNLFPYVIFKGNFDPAKFATYLAAKDLRLAVEYADELGVRMSVIPEAARALAAALEHGLSDRDWSSYITLLEQQANVEVRT